MKIKDKEKKTLVEAYQKQVRESIDRIKSREYNLSQPLKDYINNLEDNIKMAPYTLGYARHEIE